MNLDLFGWEAANMRPKPLGGGWVNFLKGMVLGHVWGYAVMERQAGDSAIAVTNAGTHVDGYFTYGLIRSPTK